MARVRRRRELGENERRGVTVKGCSKSRAALTSRMDMSFGESINCRIIVSLRYSCCNAAVHLCDPSRMIAMQSG